MEIILPLILFAVGLLILIKSADALVSGASSFASTLKISPMVIGLTVVAFGTSAPELTVSVSSALSGNTDLALGNIIGSNIANILLILGISAIVCDLTVYKNTVWKEIPMSFLGALLLFVLALQNLIDSGTLLSIPILSDVVIGSITASNGIVLLAFFIVFLYYTFGIAKHDQEGDTEIVKRKPLISLTLAAIGIIGLVIGSKLLVDSGTVIARAFGVSDALIGLSLVAFGTSLPELITSVMAAFKKQVDIAVGNVIGSNIFNIFLVLGVTSLVAPIPLKAYLTIDILVLFAATIFLFISLFVWKKGTLTKYEGGLMLVAYIAYVGYIIMRG